MCRRLTLWGMLALWLAGCTLSNQAISVTPTPELPTVEFLFPANDAQVYESTDMTISLLAVDRAVGIAKIELLVDEQPHLEAAAIEQPSVPIFTADMNWLAINPGRHTLTATAYRLDGTAVASKTMVIEVLAR